MRSVGVVLLRLLFISKVHASKQKNDRAARAVDPEYVNLKLPAKGKLEAKELWGKTPNELRALIAEHRKEAMNLRTAKMSKQASIEQLKHIKIVRSNIDRLLNVLNDQNKVNIRKQYMDAGVDMPKELRPKLSKKLRNALKMAAKLPAPGSRLPKFTIPTLKPPKDTSLSARSKRTKASTEAETPADSMVDDAVDKLFERALGATRLQHTDLSSAALRKPCHV